MSYLYIFIAVLFIVCRGWFIPGSLSSGDWGYRFLETSRAISPWFVSWSTYFGDGLGGGRMILAPLDTWYILTSRIAAFLSINPDITERIVWFIPLIIVAMYSAITLARTLTPSRMSGVAVLYVLNTYVLTILAGGQMGVVWAVALAPLVLFYTMRVADSVIDTGRHSIFDVLRMALVISVQLMFDARIVYVTLMAVSVYYVLILWQHGWVNRRTYALLGSMFWAGLLVFVLNAFWIVPLLLYPVPLTSSLGPEYLSSEALRFFSFADFSHAMSWLHPNWPENIFGKTYFLQPEFLILPIIAFSSLIFIGKEKGNRRMRILYFSLIGLIGAFLVKGVNPFFGGMYEWMFLHIPGFVMFRDPTKFYVLVSLSYSVLIPYAIGNLLPAVKQRLPKRYQFSGSVIVTLSLIALMLFLFRNIFFGMPKGTFAPQQVPPEYIALKNYLVHDDGFYRILWVPAKSRYGYFDDDKPGISLGTLSLASSSSFVSWIQDPESDRQLARYAVKYIIVPTDTKRELFVTDREYDDSMRQSVITAIEATGRFERIAVGDALPVYRVPFSSEHAYFVDQPDATVDMRRISVTEYRLVVPIQTIETRLVFSESYNPYWRLTGSGVEFKPDRTGDGLQEYRIPKGVGGSMTLSYIPQRIVIPALWMTGAVLIMICIVLVMQWRKTV